MVHFVHCGVLSSTHMYVLALPVSTLKPYYSYVYRKHILYQWDGGSVCQTHTPASPIAMDHHSILETRFQKHSEKSVSSNVKLETEMQK